MSFASSVLFTSLFYIDPISIIGNSSANIFLNFSTFHTFVYHHLVILFSFLTVSLKFYNPKVKHLYVLTLLFSAYTATAVYFAHTLNTNFASLLYNNIEVLQRIIDNYGYIVYTSLMYLFALISMISITLATIKIRKYRHKIINITDENPLNIIDSIESVNRV